MKKTIRIVVEKMLNIKLFRQPLRRGIDFYYDIDNCFGLANFRTVFDIGANIGQSAKVYADRFPFSKIHSFEPVTSTFSQLQENTKSIGKRIHLVQSAMGDKEEQREIYVNKSSLHNSIVYAYPESSKELIAIDTVDAYMRRNDIKAVDFVKIDTEGYELEVIRGAEAALRSESIGVLYIESEPTPTPRHFVPFESLRSALSEFGYKVFGIYGQQPRFTGEKHLLFFNVAFVCDKLSEQGVSPDAYPLHG